PTITNGSNGNQIGTAAKPIDPKLSEPLDNGGPTPTCLLLKGSPALDAGKSFGLTRDERDLPRPNDLAGIANINGSDGSDIGALELQTAVVTNYGDSGVGSLRLAVNDALDDSIITVPDLSSGHDAVILTSGA